MLHQISWFNYAAAIAVLAIFYYGYVGLTYFRLELQAGLFRITGKRPALSTLSGGDIAIPAFEVAGAIKADDIEYVAPEELSFGPAEETDTAPSQPDIHLLGEFSEMISEVKTLIRVINESSESKENFEMLFRLVVQKYHSLAGTPYEAQVNDYLLNESADQFPFSLELNELQTYWRNDDEKN